MVTLKGVISYPIPLFQNLPIQAQFYQPSRFVIAAIDIGPTTKITTSLDHNYVIGQQVRLLIPANCGIAELNEQSGYVLTVPATNQVVLNISTIGFNAFVSATGICQPQILALGDISNGAINGSGITNQGTFIPGSFTNISPL